MMLQAATFEMKVQDYKKGDEDGKEQVISIATAYMPVKKKRVDLMIHAPGASDNQKLLRSSNSQS